TIVAERNSVRHGPHHNRAVRTASARYTPLHLRFWLAFVPVFALGCDDTAIILHIHSNRHVPTELDAFCVEIDAAGSARFEERFAVPPHPLPQTLTVQQGGGDSFVAAMTTLAQGIAVDDMRATIAFRAHEVRDVDVALDRCPAAASSGQYGQLNAPALGAIAGADAAVVVQT